MEPFGVITQGIDFTLIILYSFWLFFFGLVFYLLREGRREGYPLVDDVTGKRGRGGVIWIPSPKTFVTSSGEVHYAPDRKKVEPEVINAVPSAPFPGSPLVPVGNPLTAGVGPGSYVMRQDRPDVNARGELKLVPMRLLPEHTIAVEDADPRGMEVVGADGQPAGTVTDMWVDRSEMLVRYLEVKLDPTVVASTVAVEPVLVAAHADAVVVTDDGIVAANDEVEVVVAAAPVTDVAPASDLVLLPMNAATVAPTYGQVSTPCILAHQFGDVPRTKAANEVTLREEDKIMAYFSAGELYATPGRSEPLL